MTIYISRTAKFLPNDPIKNDEMEEILGKINEKASRAKRITLSHNKIGTRYYAMDKNGNATHTNAELAKNAILQLFDNEYKINETGLLACATSIPDQIAPSHTAIVHGLLPEIQPIDIISPSGVCCASMHALKYSYLALKSGEIDQAVCCGSELLSPLMKASMFDQHIKYLSELSDNPILEFGKDFLRFMLSDGAGAFLLSTKPTKNNPCYKIEWIENISYANELPVCMHLGLEDNEETSNDDLKSWKLVEPNLWSGKSIFSLKQNVKTLLNIAPYGVKFVKKVLAKHQVEDKKIDHFLVHLSSMYFEKIIHEEFIKQGMDIPLEKWFTNLKDVGNIGCASIYTILHDLPSNREVKKGDTILIAVPESGRFSYSIALLTVV